MTEAYRTNSALRICVDCLHQGTMEGRVFSGRLTAPLVFTDWSSLALRLERIFDQQKLPQAFQGARTFLCDTHWAEDVAVGDTAEGMSMELIRAQYGQLATFEMVVVTRRYSSWQGWVDWLDGSARQPFTGFLELLHIVEEKVSSLK